MNTLIIIIESTSKFVWDIAKTPNIDKALPHSYERAISASNWTLPSVASIISGRYPDVHGVQRDGDMYTYRGADVFSVAQGLGKKTVLLSSVPYSVSLGRAVSIRRIYHDPKNPYNNTPKMLGELAEIVGREEDYLALIHTAETHNPYGHPRNPAQKVLSTHNKRLEESFPEGYKPTREEAYALLDAYGQVMAYQIEQIEYLDNLLKEPLEAYKEADIVLLADHGESWNPLHPYGHGYSCTLTPDGVHVPLLSNIATGADLEKITSTKEVYRLILGEELVQGQAESFFYSFPEDSPSYGPYTSRDNMVLVDEQGWHYARRTDGYVDGSPHFEGHATWAMLGGIIQRAKELLGRA